MAAKYSATVLYTTVVALECTVRERCCIGALDECACVGACGCVCVRASERTRAREGRRGGGSSRYGHVVRRITTPVDYFVYTIGVHDARCFAEINLYTRSRPKRGRTEEAGKRTGGKEDKRGEEERSGSLRGSRSRPTLSCATLFQDNNQPTINLSRERKREKDWEARILSSSSSSSRRAQSPLLKMSRTLRIVRYSFGERGTRRAILLPDRGTRRSRGWSWSAIAVPYAA